MLTRLQVRGFKNLVDVDVRFGPFTCIAGPNGVGKSNLFDAILFLSELADKPFEEAARSIRGGEDVEGLFTAHGDKRMSFAAEMLIPQEGEDDFGQRVEAGATYVRYELDLKLEPARGQPTVQRIRLEREELSHIKKGEAKKKLAFLHAEQWLDSVVRTSRRRLPFISTTDAGDLVRMHSDRMGSGKAPTGEFPVSTLPVTALRSAQKWNRTALLTRREMQNWRVVQLEPSALRQPDRFGYAARLTTTGGHIPSTLFRIASNGKDLQHEGRVYAETANRLAQLTESIRMIRVDRDDARQTLTLMMTDRYGLELPARALSEGTLRFIALAVLQQDPLETGLVCLEEPENGIHPRRIDTMIRLLEDIAVDTDSPADSDNPLRQVIVNTHSPVVAGRVSEGDLLFARVTSARLGDRRIPKLTLAPLDSTWRPESGMGTISKGEAITYLLGISPPEENGSAEQQARKRRVVDRFHLGPLDIIGGGARE